MNDYHEPVAVTGGTVFDGTGRAPFDADILIEDGTVRAVGAGPNGAAQRLDATGCIVCPGFIDAHGHSDLTLLLQQTADSRIYDGVTTEVCGNCGYSAFPLNEELRCRRQNGLRPLLDRDPAFRLDWSGGLEFLGSAALRPCAVNRVYQVGHGNLRALVVGRENRPATDRELGDMKRLLQAELAGTTGLSTGLAYPPGGYADERELVELGGVLGDTGTLYTTHIRDEGDRLEHSIEEALAVGRAAGAVHISHLKTMWPRNWHKIGFLRSRLAAARAEGLDVTADRYPYTAASTDLDYILPPWLSEGGVAEEIVRLRSGVVQEMLRLHAAGLEERTPDFWERVVISRTHSGAPMMGLSGQAIPPAGRSVADLSRLTGLAPWRVVVDLLARENTRVDVIYHALCEENLREILSWDFVMVGSDSGVRAVDGPLSEGCPHPRAFGTFARFLSRYSELGGGPIPLAQAIRKVTAMPAERFGLTDRGRIRQGLAADLVVFDPAAVRDKATFEAPLQYSEGIRHLIVNGVPVLLEGEPTGRLAGRALRPERRLPAAARRRMAQAG